MGVILTSQFDYDSIRHALGLEKDQARLLTDNVIEAFPHLPMAELEVIRRYTPPVQPTDYVAVLVARDPADLSLNALKAGIASMCCAFLCPRLETTIPVKAELSDLGNIERVKIDWVKKRQQYIDLSNWFLSLIEETLIPHAFPRLISKGHGRLYANDPIFHRDAFGQHSDYSGYIYPAVLASQAGAQDGFLYGFSFSV